MNPHDLSQRLPTGVRDVLPAEAAELRDAEAAIRRTLRLAGYREVRTPVLEYGAATERAAARGLDEAYRLFDADGAVLVLRPDLTIPAARLIATRMADHPGPIRVAYTAAAFRLPQPGKPRLSEHRQAGAELVGPTGPAADAELLELLCECLAEAGLPDARVAVGSAAIVGAALEDAVADPERREALRRAAAMRNHVAWRALAEGLPAALLDLPARHGSAAVLDDVAKALPATSQACGDLSETISLLAGTAAENVVHVDLGIVHERSYYDGIMIEAYAPGVGAPLARGGRYDALAARFGRPRPAIGFGIEIDPLHRALVASRGPREVSHGAVVVADPVGDRATLAALRQAGLPVVAAANAEAAHALADADGWRYVIVPSDDGHVVHDRANADQRTVSRLGEDLSWLR